ncbi:MAG: dihydrofolate reductase [Pseudomonadota bacterium]
MSDHEGAGSPEPRLALVVAVAENGVIGREGALPWRLPGDLKRFKAITMGKPMVMGRKTFTSIGRPLPGRANIVVSRAPLETDTDGLHWAPSPDAAETLAREIAIRDGASEIAVIGGAEIYAVFLPRAARLYWTRVAGDVAGDAIFPAVDWSEWRLVDEEPGPPDPRASHAFTFQTFDRRAPGPSD